MKRRALVLTALLLANTLFGQAPAGSGRTFGTPVSAITIDLYSDFQCPHCKKLYDETLRPLIQNYASKGRVYLVEHYYPLPMHAYARPAACYACAADRIGKYEQVCDVLFKQQDEWSRTGKVDETACSVLTASEAAQVRALAKSASVTAEVQRDVDLGISSKVGGTPTMLISYNGKTYPPIGDVSYSLLSRFLDSLH
jgi:protein-disulfide isomerase